MNEKSKHSLETSEKFPKLGECVSDRKSYLVLNSIMRLSYDDDLESVRPIDLQKKIKKINNIDYTTRYIHSILKDLVKNNVVEKDEEKKGRYLISDSLFSVLEDIEDAFDKAKCLEGEFKADDYIRTVIYDIKPERFFDDFMFIRFSESMRSIGFKTKDYYLTKEKKEDLRFWNFVNIQHKFVEIVVFFEEMDQVALRKYSRKEDSAVKMEVHIHIRGNHRMYKDKNFEIIKLDGSKEKNTSILQYESSKYKLTEEGIIKRFCNSLATTIGLQVNDLLAELHESIVVLIHKHKKREEIFSED